MEAGGFFQHNSRADHKYSYLAVNVSKTSTCKFPTQKNKETFLIRFNNLTLKKEMSLFLLLDKSLC